jgi:hypothetical protein
MRRFVGVFAFSGHRWNVKESRGRVGPGPNFFGSEGVWVDARGRLHLAILKKRTGWVCSEVVLDRSLGYGEYRFRIWIDTLDRNAVFGMFLWDGSAPRLHYREVDIELSRWGDPRKPNAQFAVQPYQKPGNLVRFELPKGLAQVSFDWRRGSLFCRTGVSDRVVKEHRFTRMVPKPGREHARMNVWLYHGGPPASGKTVEVIVERFGFMPALAPAR